MLFWQQPELQLLGPQRLTQEPFWHCVPVGQLTQTAPPVPQAVFVLPDWQVLFWQQPLGQLVALQTQEPLTQVVPVGQATQATPFEPHAWFVLPARQVVPSQQPLGQLVGLQTQEPFLHSVPVGHAAQMAPLEPHAWFVLPGRQVVPSQQPLGQLAGVQMHCPWPLQTWPAPQVEVHVCVVWLQARQAAVLQATHVTPPVPQAVFAFPV